MLQPEFDSLPSYSAMLREALSDFLAPGAHSFLQMLADDAVMEFPYAPPGIAGRLEGRAAITAHVNGLGHILTIERMTDLVVYPTTRPGVVVLEFGCLGSGVSTGKPYNQTYISVITLRDGHIVHYRDYWNPLVVLGAMEQGEAAPEAPVGGVN